MKEMSESVLWSCNKMCLVSPCQVQRAQSFQLF